MIRKSTAGDIDRIMEIWLEGNISAHGFIPRSYWKANFRGVRQAIGGAEVYVYESGGEVCGFIGLIENYIAGLFIAEGSRSKGFGEKLLNYVKNKKQELTLGVYAENERAVKFYNANGFSVAEKKIEEETGRTEYTMKWVR